MQPLSMVCRKGGGMWDKKINIKSLIDETSSNTTRRFDCPNCNGSNTFSVTKKGGQVLYHCFKLACGLSGMSYNPRSISEMESAANIFKDKKEEPKVFYIPSTWEKIVKGDEKYKYLERFNANFLTLDSYFYDKIQNRLVFVDKDKRGNVTMAIGRALDGRLPKWYKYFTATSNTYYEVYSKKERTYIVEDCLSAIAISKMGNSIALCGTNYDVPALVKSLKELGTRDVTICLDADAQEKALKLKLDLDGMWPGSVKVVALSDDAKYLDMGQLERQLKICQ